jgi:hypothetical protein
MAEAVPRSITRRALVAASVMPVLPAPGCAASDPIYTAIAAHRRAYADVIALIARQDVANAALQAAGAADRAALAARLHELCEAEGPLGRAEMNATDRLLATVPETLAGAAATLAYVRVLFERDDYPITEDDGYRTLLASTECAIVRAL